MISQPWQTTHASSIPQTGQKNSCIPKDGSSCNRTAGSKDASPLKNLRRTSSSLQEIFHESNNEFSGLIQKFIALRGSGEY